jgi:hypothetical protein
VHCRQRMKGGGRRALSSTAGPLEGSGSGGAVSRMAGGRVSRMDGEPTREARPGDVCCLDDSLARPLGGPGEARQAGRPAGGRSWWSWSRARAARVRDGGRGEVESPASRSRGPRIGRTQTGSGACQPGAGWLAFCLHDAVDLSRSTPKPPSGRRKRECGTLPVGRFKEGTGMSNGKDRISAKIRQVGRALHGLGRQACRRRAVVAPRVARSWHARPDTCSSVAPNLSLMALNIAQRSDLVTCLQAGFAVEGDVVRSSGSPARHVASAPYNRRLSDRVEPLALAYPFTPAAIATALGCARSTNGAVDVQARSGGHNHGAFRRFTGEVLTSTPSASTSEPSPSSPTSRTRRPSSSASLITRCRSTALPPKTLARLVRPLALSRRPPLGHRTGCQRRDGLQP